MRVKYEDLLEKFQRILESRGFSGKHAKDAATVFANNSLDGVYSHGVNRFPGWWNIWIRERLIPAPLQPVNPPWEPLSSGTATGFGPLNAKLAMDRAVELAREYGVGVVAAGIITTGCGAAATAGRQRTRDASVSAGPTPCPTCLPGAAGTEKSETIHLSCPSPEAAGNTLSLTVPYPSFPTER